MLFLSTYVTEPGIVRVSNRGCIRTLEQLHQPGLAASSGVGPQVLPIELQQVEREQLQLAVPPPVMQCVEVGSHHRPQDRTLLVEHEGRGRAATAPPR